MNLLTKINDNMSGFSKGQKLIANFITEHYDKAAFMTASKLGTTVGVSESTVVRFATELGYDGYPKMQKAMQEMIRDKLTSVQRIEVTKSRLSGSDVLSSVLNQDIEKIRRTLEETSKDDFANAVRFRKAISFCLLVILSFDKEGYLVAFIKVLEKVDIQTMADFFRNLIFYVAAFEIEEIVILSDKGTMIELSANENGIFFMNRLIERIKDASRRKTENADDSPDNGKDLVPLHLLWVVPEVARISEIHDE